MIPGLKKLKALRHCQKKGMTGQQNSYMAALVITLYCEPFEIAYALDSAIHLEHAKPVLDTCNVYMPTVQGKLPKMTSGIQCTILC